MPGKTNHIIDISMDVILAISPEGTTWTRDDIADVCGCSHEYIRELEAKAIRKLRSRTILKDYANGCI